MDTVSAHLKGEREMVPHDESGGVLRAQRLQGRRLHNQCAQSLRGGGNAEHETRDAPHSERRVQRLGQPRRGVAGGADQQELAARRGRSDRLVQGASPRPLRLR
jgi:hypothetical protein